MKLPTLPPTDGKTQTLRDKIYMSTPVFLTVIATVLAGLSSGEMTRAQYFRSFAAQQQGKATDQWGYFQAKKTRAAMYQTDLDLMRASAHPLARFQPAVAEALGPSTQPDDAEKFAKAFEPIDQQLPALEKKSVGDANIQEAIKNVEDNRTEKEMTPLLRQINDEEMAQALADADANASAFDVLIKPASSALDGLHKALDKIAGSAESAAIQQNITDVAAARLRFNAARYDREAQYNQAIGELYEVQVHRFGVISDRHAERSSYFFYGMLAAQGGVTIATLALAMRQKSVFWSLATAAGVIAVTFSAYIYLYM